MKIMNWIQGHSMQQFQIQIKQDLPETYVTGIGFWSIVQLWNFRMIPIHYQSVFVHCVSVFWDGFLSYRHHHSSSPSSSTLTSVSASTSTSQV